MTLELRNGDGSKETRTLPNEMWNLGNRYTARFATATPVTGVVIDPTAVLPDVNRGNNSWAK